MSNKFEYDSFDSFRHGLVLSKLWLCEELEKVMLTDKKYNLRILGAWTNLLSFMLLTRNRNLYNSVHAYDIDESANKISACINDTWLFEEPKVYTHLEDINSMDYSNHGQDNIYINCSVEHLESREWFNKIPNNSIVAIQATNMNEVNEPWYIKDYVPSLQDLSMRYPLYTLYEGTKTIMYPHFQYNRFMHIGMKH